LIEFDHKSEGIPSILDKYLQNVAMTGITVFGWSKLKPLLLCKLDVVTRQFNERSPMCEEQSGSRANVETCTFTELQQRLMNMLQQFNGTPFTIQRLCELLTSPSKHYQKTDKFMRGLEKNLAVVTTVDSQGNRVLHESKPLVNGLETSGGSDGATSPLDDSLGSHDMESLQSLNSSPYVPPAPHSSPVTGGTVPLNSHTPGVATEQQTTEGQADNNIGQQRGVATFSVSTYRIKDGRVENNTTAVNDEMSSQSTTEEDDERGSEKREQEQSDDVMRENCNKKQERDESSSTRCRPLDDPEDGSPPRKLSRLQETNDQSQNTAQTLDQSQDSTQTRDQSEGDTQTLDQSDALRQNTASASQDDEKERSEEDNVVFAPILGLLLGMKDSAGSSSSSVDPQQTKLSSDDISCDDNVRNEEEEDEAMQTDVLETSVTVGLVKDLDSVHMDHLAATTPRGTDTQPSTQADTQTESDTNRDITQLNNIQQDNQDEPEKCGESTEHSASSRLMDDSSAAKNSCQRDEPLRSSGHDEHSSSLLRPPISSRSLDEQVKSLTGEQTADNVHPSRLDEQGSSVDEPSSTADEEEQQEQGTEVLQSNPSVTNANNGGDESEPDTDHSYTMDIN